MSKFVSSSVSPSSTISNTTFEVPSDAVFSLSKNDTFGALSSFLIVITDCWFTLDPSVIMRLKVSSLSYTESGLILIITSSVVEKAGINKVAFSNM